MIFDPIKGTLYYLIALGIKEVFLPFIFVFIICYAILDRIKLFDSKIRNIVVAKIIGLIFIYPHVTGIGPDFVPFMYAMIPSFALIFVAVVALSFILTLFGISFNKDFFFSIIAFLVIVDIIIPDILLISLAAKYFNVDLPPAIAFITADWFMYSLVIIGVTTILIYFITKD